MVVSAIANPDRLTLFTARSFSCLTSEEQPPPAFATSLLHGSYWPEPIRSVTKIVLRSSRILSAPGGGQHRTPAPLALDVVVLELLVERRAIDLEDRGRLRFVAAGRGER